MSLANMTKSDQYQRIRSKLAEWDAQAAAQVEEKKQAGYYKPRPDPRKQQPIAAGTVVTFTSSSGKGTGRVVRHEDVRNFDGENDYGWVRVYWIMDDKTGRTLPVDSEKVKNG